MNPHPDNPHLSAAPSPTMTTLASFAERLRARQDLGRKEAAALLDALLAQEATDAEIAAVLTAMAEKGETADELAGMAEAMRARMVALRCESTNVVDTAGTGASKVKTFNVSTAAAFVIAAAGVPIAKHGARAATSNSGSADVLKELGCEVQLPVESSERLLAEHGICFLFAPQYHPAAARVAPIRRQLGFRTIFNLIGPLSSPSRARYQVMGVGDASVMSKMADALAGLGCERGFVVHGEDGLDEISLATTTRVAEVRNGSVRMTTLSPEDFGIKRGPCGHLRAEDAKASAARALEVLSGRGDVNATDLVVLNAAAALMVVQGMDARSAAERARSAIESGAALAKLECVRAAARGRT